MANKSRSDALKALEICSLGDKKQEHGYSCDDCAYAEYAYGTQGYRGTNCDEELMKDALEYLNQ